jgi:hypothetical protein
MARRAATFRPREHGAVNPTAAMVIGLAPAGAVGVQDRQPPERVEGGIVRGPRQAILIALEFTGHEFAAGATTILDELARHRARGSFFLTGDVLRRAKTLVSRDELLR